MKGYKRAETLGQRFSPASLRLEQRVGACHVSPAKALHSIARVANSTTSERPECIN